MSPPLSTGIFANTISTFEAERSRPLNDLVKIAADVALDKKAEDIVILDLRGISDVTDFFLIAHGNSDRQVEAIADAIERTLRNHKARPIHVEGRSPGDWILMDYFDFVVHLFRAETREFYRLENLWADAPREQVTLSDKASTSLSE